jgi:uncharacterized protein YndB with AHSA1/START domain
MSGSVRLSTFIPAPPVVVYQAWLNGRQHAAMTGAKATSQARVGGKFTAWSGYIFGQHQELVPSRRIVQSWRTTEFPEDCPDSRLEVEFAPEGDGTRLTLVQTELPAGEAERYQEGWQQFYFEPIQQYFGRLGLKSAAGSEPPPQPAETPPRRRRIVVGTAASMPVSAPQPVRRERRRPSQLLEASAEQAPAAEVEKSAVQSAKAVRKSAKPAPEMAAPQAQRRAAKQAKVRKPAVKKIAQRRAAKQAKARKPAVKKTARRAQRSAAKPVVRKPKRRAAQQKARPRSRSKR